MSLLSDNALKIAISQIGAKESPIGSNWGHPVQDYLASVDVDFPASWCMAFLYWSFLNGNVPVVLTAGLNAFPVKTAGVLYAWAHTPDRCKITGDPLRGDIFIMDLGKGTGHCGLVETVTDHKLNTIEGNTNDTGSREGFEVIRKVRYDQAPIIGYLRF